MPEIDDFARSLLEESKRYLEKASELHESAAIDACLHAALMLAFCSLEAHINAIGEEFGTRPDFSVHEKGVLLEKEVRLENGEFVLSNSLKMTRLEDRIQFLHVKFSAPLDRSKPVWSQLMDALALRNQLTHPKGMISITEAAVSRAIQAIIDTLDGLYRAIYGKAFPAAGRGLQSKLTF
jgi:hypothetical protein